MPDISTTYALTPETSRYKLEQVSSILSLLAGTVHSARVWRLRSEAKSAKIEGRSRSRPQALACHAPIFRVDLTYVLESNPYTTEHIFSSNSGSIYTIDLIGLYLDRDHSSSVGHVFSSFKDLLDSNGFFLLRKTRKDIWKENIRKKKRKRYALTFYSVNLSSYLQYSSWPPSQFSHCGLQEVQDLQTLDPASSELKAGRCTLILPTRTWAVLVKIK